MEGAGNETQAVAQDLRWNEKSREYSEFVHKITHWVGRFVLN